MATIVQAVNLKKLHTGQSSIDRSSKSTLLNLIGALDKPTEGNMLIEGIGAVVA